ncbi:MAG: hypothetical protein HRT35_21770 [Algicola sp.]|nr:hypothetical protein [Algicola sp.]
MFKQLLLIALTALTVGASAYTAGAQSQTPVDTVPKTNESAPQTQKSESEQTSPAKLEKIPERKYKAKKKEDDSILDSVSKTIGDAIGMLSLDGRTEGDEGVPRRIAVLPAIGEGDDRERDDIRTVIHNNLSSKNFDLLKPFDIDRKLAELEQTEGKKHTDYDPMVLAQKLQVEGLIFVDVPLVEKVYAAAYAHYKITIRLSFFSSFDNNFIWEKEETIAEREGGISLNPLSFIAQAISSAQVLTEAVRQTLVDKLARIFAAEIPFPIGKRAKIKPVRIELALSNEGDGPFRAGDEVTVVMRAEPGLAATFDIGNKFVGLRLAEQGEGEYVGRYVVNDNDNADGLIVKINATRIDDRAEIAWRVPGRIGIDTIVPGAITSLASSPVKDAIKLNWPSESTSHETLTYHIERADPQTGLYKEIAAINIQEYIDSDIVEGNNYHYRIFAQDEARNQSPYASIQVAAVGVGPTEVEEDMIADTTFYAVASPYIIDKPIRVLRNATLTLSPGTIIEFTGEGKLEVLGQIKGMGTKQSTIAISGEPWQLLFSNTGENQSQFSYTNFDNGNISVDQSAVAFDNITFKSMKTAVALSNNGNLSVTHSQFLQNDIALLVEDGQLVLNDVRFVANKQAWKVTGRQEYMATKLRFEDNDLHVASVKDMVVKNAVFNDLDYQDLLSKLEGPVKVDFSGIADKHNLLKTWLKDRWMMVLDSAKAGLWQETHDALLALRNHTQDSRMDAFGETLNFMTGKPVGKSGDFILTVQRFARRNENGRLWVQEVKLPYSKNTVNSDGYIKKQASKKLSNSYLKANYPSLRPAQLRKYKRKVKMDKNIVASQVIYATKKGLFLHVWLANYLDMDKINRSLTLAGLIKRENSELTIGLLSQTDVFEFEELIVKALKKQGIKYISLGTGSYGKPAQLKAQKMGANIVLETAVMVDSTQSGISKNLKMVDVNLVLDLYDVETNSTLDHLTASANAAGFKQREIVNKAVIESYGTVESKLLAALWSADDVVVEHKKERLKREKIAKAKADKERKARARKEKKRLAKEKAASEEKARLARVQAAKDKAEAQQRLAKQKAAQDKAERLAKEKAKADAEKAKLARTKQTPPEGSGQKQQNGTVNDIEP